MAPSPDIASVAYEPNVLSTELDWVAIAANDYYASTTGRTAYLVPLEGSEVAGINSFVSTYFPNSTRFTNVLVMIV